MDSYLALIQRRPSFRLLWLASVVSLLGDWFNAIASVIIVSRYTDSGLALGGIFIARTLPQFIFGPVAGVVADRFNRKHVMVVSDVLRALIVLSFLFIDRPERLWWIYALTSIQFAISAFFQPASSAILPSLVQRDELVTGNVISSITWSAMLALGAALGGGVAALFGASTALIIDAATYLVSAVFVSRIALPARIAEAAPIETSGWTDMLEGFRYVRRNTGMALLASVKSLSQIGNGDIIVAVYAEQLFIIGQGGAGSLGLLYAAAGLGAVLGPLLGRRLDDESNQGLRSIISSGFVLIPIGWAVVALAPNIWIAMLGLLLRLAGGSINWTFSNVLIQKQVPDRYLGRVFALDFALFTLTSAAAIWLSGLLLDTVLASPRHLPLLFALGSIPPIFVWFWHQRQKSD